MLSICQLLGAHKYSISYRIVSYSKKLTQVSSD